MLVLSRRVGERIQIGDDIVITLNKISGNRIALGIEAPREVSIRRGELAEMDEANTHRCDDQPSVAFATLGQ